MTLIRGIDVSKWQPTVEWAKVRADGIAFAVPKASQATWQDALFAKHWKGAKEAGLLRGAYHFYTPDAPPLKQLDAYSKALGDDPGDLPPVLDIECKTTNPAQLAKDTLVWLTEAEKRFGRKPLIYTAAWYWNPTMLIGGKYPEWAADYQLWVAAYPVSTGAPSLDDLAAGKYKALLPKSWTDYALWQYSEKGRVDGVATNGKPANTDLNIYRGTLENLAHWLGKDPAALADLPVFEPMVSFALEAEPAEGSYGDASETAGRSAHAAEAARGRTTAKKPTAGRGGRRTAPKKPAAKKPAPKKKPAAKKPAARKK